MVIKEYITSTDHIARFIALWLRTWIIMLCIGGIGHQLNVPFLYKFDFLTVMLVIFVIEGLQKLPISKWITEDK